MPDFKGYISDLGGPSANMYGMHGRDLSICSRCMRPSCLHPRRVQISTQTTAVCLTYIKSVDRLPGVKKSFIGSGVRA